ncbi:phage integrase Arm DNA-binding domain-containing protein, partial [Escherichia coli]
MAARPRSHKISIPNLYCKLDKRTGKVYWQYKHPLSGRFHSLGTDENEAKQVATEANTIMNRPGFPGEYFICELRLPDHRFRWK